jgi:beta-phosphoglucomutase-like phosphatase (HAD superfamily)
MIPSAVILDLDGVIAETENLNRVAWERTLGGMGLELPAGATSMPGVLEMHDPIFLSAVLKREGIDPDQADIEGWCRRKRDLMGELLAEGTTLVPGAPELIGAIRGRARLALATGAARSDVDAALSAARLGDAFETVATIDDPEAHQFPPHVFKLALARLGLEPGDAVAVVGSKRGRLASIQAGIRMVSIGPPPIRPELAGGDVAVPDLRDTSAVLAALGLS